ncbi:hypothetical protein NECAME_07645 [Necator americanus]|uniref:Uncharacterized protein n=1 Tax=Necator americanus TaxID=51031 RepID=W2TPC9_NECAM|nr:hypothetical protein NECAME_07645 [Necator americanus]ETN82991.1 hypothetical protein NECAME_07645 [Necator americanus]
MLTKKKKKKNGSARVIVTSVYNIAAFPSPTSHDPETGYTREAAIMHLSEKNTRLVSMREGLKKTIEYFRDQINEHQRLSEEP